MNKLIINKLKISFVRLNTYSKIKINLFNKLKDKK